MCLLYFTSNAQFHVNPDTLKVDSSTKNQVKLLASASLCSTFLIVLQGEVKMHYHAFHTENAMVTEGKGIMKLGDKEFEIKEGDLFDADIHEAISQINSPTIELKGKIITIVENGYKLGDKIIRYPKVIIGQ